jgi:hypothetical protein
LLICRIHGLLGDSVPTIGEGVEENPCFVIGGTIFPGSFFFHFTHLAIRLFSEDSHFTR